MGHVRNHAILVTAVNAEAIQTAYKKACKIFPWVSEISPQGTNGSQSFFVPPDGSKVGWSESDGGDKRRASFKRWLKSSRALYLHWVELYYGGDDLGEAKITAQTK